MDPSHCALCPREPLKNIQPNLPKNARDMANFHLSCSRKTDAKLTTFNIFGISIKSVSKSTDPFTKSLDAGENLSQIG